MRTTRLLRIAYLVQQSGIRLDDRGGGAVHVRAIVSHLRRIGHQVTFVRPEHSRRVFCSGDPERAYDAKLGVTSTQSFKWFESSVRRTQGSLRLPYLALFDSLRFYEACAYTLSGYDIFHERFSMLGIGGVLAARRLGIPLVLEVNADLLDELDSIGQGPRGVQRLAVRWASALCFRRATVIVAVSNQLKAHLVRVWNLAEDKIVVLPNGTDVDRFKLDIDPPKARARLSLVEAPTVMFVGGFFPWHASLGLLESFALVRERVDGAHLYLVGDGPMKPAAEARSHDLGLGGSVTFVGEVPHQDIPGWLAAADVAVAPFTAFSSGTGRSPLKLFEYMAAGKAIVATRTGQVGEVLRHNENGLLVEPGDVDGFAYAVATLLKDPAIRTELGQNARRQAVEHHSWGQYVVKLEDIYRRLGA